MPRVKILAARTEMEPDALDTETLDLLLASAGYELLLARFERTLAAEVEALAHTQSWEDTVRKQGFIAGLRRAADMPRILKAEITGRNQP